MPSAGHWPLAAASVAPQANIVVTAPGLPVNSLKDLVALARTRNLSYASPDAGSVPQLLFEHFSPTPEIKESQLGFEPTSIPGDQFQRDVESELNMCAGVIETAGIKPQ
ncbi:MAG TPA: hypothetical protein VGD13_16595 [Xanthobacteraceae bacterium]